MFFEEPIRWIMTAIPKWLGHIGFSLVNHIFAQAAKSSLYSLVISIVVLIIVYIAGYSVVQLKDISKTIKDRLNITEELLEPQKITHYSTEQQKDECRPEIALEQLRQADKKLYSYIVRTIIIIIFFYLSSGLYIIAPHMLKSEFDKTITIIKPYTTEETINLLESEWAQMQNYSDFSEINTVMLDIKNEIKISP